MKTFLRNVAVSLATIIGYLTVIGILITAAFFFLQWLYQYTLSWYITLGAVVLFVLTAVGWRLAEDCGWIKK